MARSAHLIADCLAKVWAGTDIDYDGASGPLDFSPNGEPGGGTYNVIQYNADGASENQAEIHGRIAAILSRNRTTNEKGPVHAGPFLLSTTPQARTPAVRESPGRGR